MKWYEDSPVIFLKSAEFAIVNRGRREGPLWISNTHRCPVQQPPKGQDGTPKDGQKEKSIIDVGN